MLAVFAILIFTAYLAFFFPVEAKEKVVEEKSPKYTAQMKKLWQVAQTSMRERKPFRAEKALLTILKFDEKNAAAYNRLGILYAKEQKYDEAVECFEIAQSLDNNPASIHNAGLIYLETGAYEKAEMAFLQAIELEGDIPARYIALAKAEEKLGNTKKSIEALENAYEIDPNVSTLRQILAIYEATEDAEATAVTMARIEEQIARETAVKNKKTTRVSRVAKPAAKVAKPAGATKVVGGARATAKVARPVSKVAGSVSRVARPVAKTVSSVSRIAKPVMKTAASAAKTVSRPVSRVGKSITPRKKIQ
ncbi:MAG: tetratricopeptide repeat protein [Candidatus Saccharibacteria bacterium]|nr:tetratricopeptide repeat protein [Candidatus Saccharibacteria bacterium]